MTHDTAFEPWLQRFDANLELIGQLLTTIPEDRLREARVPGKWPALGHLAHLGQFHDLIQARFEAIVRQDNPTFARFSPDDEPDTARWMQKNPEVLLADFRARRADLLAWLRTLTPEQWARVGTHKAFGTMNVAQWLAFYLQHEGHHIYTAMVLART